MAGGTPRMRPHSKPSSYYIKISWLLVCPAGLLLWRIRGVRRRRAIIVPPRRDGYGILMDQPFPPRRGLGRAGTIYLCLPHPPVRAQGKPVFGGLGSL